MGKGSCRRRRCHLSTPLHSTPLPPSAYYEKSKSLGSGGGMKSVPGASVERLRSTPGASTERPWSVPEHTRSVPGANPSQNRAKPSQNRGLARYGQADRGRLGADKGIIKHYLTAERPRSVHEAAPDLQMHTTLARELYFQRFSSVWALFRSVGDVKAVASVHATEASPEHP